MTAQLNDFVESLETILDVNSKKPLIDPLANGPQLETYSPPQTNLFRLLRSSVLGLFDAGRKVLQADADTEQNKLIALEERNRATTVEYERFREDLAMLKSEAVEHYFDLVCEQLEFPDDFPLENIELSFDPSSKHLFVKLVCPNTEVVPITESLKFVKTQRKFSEKIRTQHDIKKIYEKMIAGATLAVVKQLYRADRFKALENITVQALVDGIDPETGNRAAINLVSLNVNRDKYSQLDFGRLEPVVCLKALGADMNISAYLKHARKSDVGSVLSLMGCE